MNKINEFDLVAYCLKETKGFFEVAGRSFKFPNPTYLEDTMVRGKRQVRETILDKVIEYGKINQVSIYPLLEDFFNSTDKQKNLDVYQVLFIYKRLLKEDSHYLNDGLIKSMMRYDPIYQAPTNFSKVMGYQLKLLEKMDDKEKSRELILSNYEKWLKNHNNVANQKYIYNHWKKLNYSLESISYLIPSLVEKSPSISIQSVHYHALKLDCNKLSVDIGIENSKSVFDVIFMIVNSVKSMHEEYWPYLKTNFPNVEIICSDEKNAQVLTKIIESKLQECLLNSHSKKKLAFPQALSKEYVENIIFHEKLNHQLEKNKNVTSKLKI